MSNLRLAALLAAGCVCTGTLADPMRPLVAPAAASDATSNLSRDASTGTRNNTTLPPLLAIREDGAGQRRALIGDSWLLPGDKLGTRRVLAIAITSVTLAEDKTGKARQTLHLLPPLQRAPAPSTP